MISTKVVKTSLLTFTILAGVWAFADEVNVESKSLKDATHIEFSGRDDWRYDVSRDKQQVSVQFTGLKSEEISELLDLKDSRVKSVSIKDGTNGDALVIFALAPGESLFDYQTDQPVHLVFDIFKQEKAKAVDSAKKVKKAALKKTSQPNWTAARKGTGNRNIASVDHPEIGSQPLLETTPKDPRLQLEYGIFDGGDQKMNRFRILDGDISEAAHEAAMIKSVHSLYVHFPPLTLERPFLTNIIDEGVTKYDVPVEKTDENMQLRLLVKLFSEGKYAVVLRTLKFFYEKYPKTQYQKTLDYLTADTYFKLWQRDHDKADFDTAMARYKDLLNKYPEDPSRFHTLMFIGANYLINGNDMGALAVFEVGIEKYKESPFIFEMKLAKADVLNKLNKPEQALDQLQNIEQDPKAGTFAIDAKLRRGDIFIQKKDYATAVKEYDAAIHGLKLQLQDAPNIFFNKAEALFWEKDFKGSLDAYREFLERFPNHPFGGLAMTRIGEIFDLMGVNSKKVNGAFLESFYRYRGTPGAFLAKLYINLGRYQNMKEKEVEAVRKEISDDLAQFKYIEDFTPFVTLSLAKANRERKDYTESLNMLSDYYKSNVVSPYLALFKESLVQTVTEEMTDLQSQGENLKAVETFLSNKDSWLKGVKRVDTEYVLGQSYEALNLLDEATAAYDASMAKLNSMTPDEIKAAKVLNQLPSPDEINLRLAATSLKTDNTKKTGQYLGQIKSPEKLGESEKVERALLLSSLAEKEERTDLALLSLKELNENWKGKPELLSDAWLRLAKIENDNKNYSKAMPWAVKVIAASQNPNVKIKDETLQSAIELAGDIHSHLGQNKQAIDSYKAYLNRFGTSAPTAAVKYKLGKIYFDTGDMRSASQVWGELKTDTKGAVWAKMADENLLQANWDSKYGRYLNREPASQKTGGQK